MEKFLNEASFWMPEFLVLSAWFEHTPFAFWLLSVHRPKTIVELGTHTGFSYFAINQGIERLQLKSRCVAIDTWRGDEHAGYYGDEVFAPVNAYNTEHFADFSELLQCTFDEALTHFDDGSIDLLHIDGRHFYEDVKHDFKSWLPKLSERAVVLLHDTNVRARGFGVNKLWDELSGQFPHFEFLQGHGLGVLGVGSDLPQEVQEFFASQHSASASESVRSAYSRLGSAVADRYRLSIASDPAAVNEANRLKAELASMSAARMDVESTHKQLTHSYGELQREHLKLDAMFQDLHNHLDKSKKLVTLQAQQLVQRDDDIGLLRSERARLEKAAADLRQSENVARSALQENARLRNQCERLEAFQRELEENRRLIRQQSHLLEIQSKKSVAVAWVAEPPAPEAIPSQTALVPSQLKYARLLHKTPKLVWWTVTLQLPDRLATRRYKGLIASSGLFDSSYYLSENPDVAAAGAVPIAHYLERGALEGRNPHPLFDTAWYLKQNPDVAAIGINPLVHYLLQGWKEQRSPHPLLVPSYYSRNGYSQVAEQVPAAKHYAETGWKTGSDPHPLFDTSWYLTQYPDIAKAGHNPLFHYLQYGWKEARRPHILFDESWCLAQLSDTAAANPLVRYVTGNWRSDPGPHRLFSADFYLSQNPDVATADVDPLEHYLLQGWREGRDPHPLFDNDWYLSTYKDVADSAVNPLVHYAHHGRGEARQPNPFFDPVYYVQQTQRRESAIDDPITDYLTRGASEGLDPHPDFDSAWYLAEYPAVAKSGLNPLVHFLTKGRALGFKTSAAAARKLQGSECIRIVFLSGESHTPGHKYRVLNLATSLPEDAYETVVLSMSDDIGRIKTALSGASVVWIWRASWSDTAAEVIVQARRVGAKVVFDIDDLMFRPELAKTEIIDGIRSQSLTEDQVHDFYRKVQQLMAKADFCTVPTFALKNELNEFRKPTTVIPNGFDRKMLEAAKSAVSKRDSSSCDGLFRIGYAAGSRTHQRDLRIASKAIADILGRFDFARLVLFKGPIELTELPELEARAEQIEWRDLVPIDALAHEYARFDVNIAPLEAGNRFCEAKSELKYFEAALVGVPTVASPTAPFVHAIEHGKTGFLARTEDDWRESLALLIEKPELRKSMTDRARREVLWLYGPERRSLIETKFLDEILAPVSRSSHVFIENTKLSSVERIPSAALPECDVIFESGKRGFARVSVVIPLFNYEQFLPDALNSVLQQTIRDIDVIVVDDVSTDRSCAVAEEWLRDHAHRFNFVALLRNRKNSKLGMTRNAAVDYCDTEFFLPLDPDNLLLPNCVAALQAALEKTDSAFAYPTIELFGGQTGVIGNTEFNAADFQFGNYIDAMAMVRKACWTAVGGYAPLNPPGWEDFDFWCKFLEKGFTGTRVKDVIAKYRVHGQSMLFTTTDLPENKKEIIRQLVARHPWLKLNLAFHESTLSDKTGSQWDALQEELGTNTIETLLPILKCPITGEDLIASSDSEIVTISGSRSWPVVRGVPVFTAEGANVTLQAETHVSNPLPDKALDLIASTQGLVLNLSAGASETKFPNVVELEYSIFKHTSVSGDVHRLPFKDEVFEAIVCMNAFEHYREPDLAMVEIRRVLKPGGRLFMRTAFIQPLHESPHHYFNCTEFGLRQWLHNMKIEEVSVSDNFNPIYGLSWLLSEAEAGFRSAGRHESADLFRSSKVGEVLAFWRDARTRDAPLWHAFHELPERIQRGYAAGWQALAVKPGSGS